MKGLMFPLICLAWALSWSSVSLASPGAMAAIEPQEIVVGVGMVLSENEGVIKVDELVENAPAARSGQVMIGDRIWAVAPSAEIGWVSLEGRPLEEVVSMIRGVAGSSVGLKLQQGEGEMRDVVLVREPMNLP